MRLGNKRRRRLRIRNIFTDSSAWAWQFLFLLLSTDPERYRPMMLPSIVEKIAFGIALVILHFQHRIAASTLFLGSFDWVFAFLFVAAYSKTKPRLAA